MSGGREARPAARGEARPATERLCREMQRCLARTASAAFWWLEDHGLGVEEMRHDVLGPRARADVERRIAEALRADEAALARTHVRAPLDAEGVPILPGETIWCGDPLRPEQVVTAVGRDSVWTDGGRLPAALVSHRGPVRGDPR